MNPVVSCITPFFNAAPWLPAQLESLSKQTFMESCEFLYCDNGSTDGSREVISSWADRLPGPVRILDASKRKGPAHARNIGLHESRGEYVLCADADDRYDLDWMDAMIAESRSSGTAFVSGSNRVWDGTPGPCLGRVTNAAEGKQLDYLPMMQGGNMLGRRQTILDLGGWNEDLITGEDVDLSWRAQRAGYQIACSKRAIVDYRTRQHLKGTFRQFYRYGYYDVLMLKRYRDRPKVHKTWRKRWEEIRPIPAALVHVLQRRTGPQEVLWATQIAAKKAGHLAGSLRFGYFHF